jgi:acyl carrier protein
MIAAVDVCELIRKKLHGRLEEDVVLDENTVFAELGLSSLQLADIVYSIEDRLRIEFDTSRAAEVKTVGDLVRLANGSLPS